MRNSELSPRKFRKERWGIPRGMWWLNENINKLWQKLKATSLLFGFQFFLISNFSGLRSLETYMLFIFLCKPIHAANMQSVCNVPKIARINKTYRRRAVNFSN